MPSLSLRKTLKDAQGQAITPARLYTPITAHGRVVDMAPRVYNPGMQLRGDHEAVQNSPAVVDSDHNHRGEGGGRQGA